MSTSESSVLKRDVVMCYNDMLRKLITNHFSKKQTLQNFNDDNQNS